MKFYKIKIIVIFLLVATIFISRWGLLKIKSDSHTKQTTLKQPDSFIILGDSGTGDFRQFKIAEKIFEKCQYDCKSIFIVGDVIYEKGVNSTDDLHFKLKFEDPYLEIKKPFYIVLGNHDYLGCVECYIQYSSVSEKWVMPARYYLKEYNNAVFIIVDTENFDKEQLDWIKANILKIERQKKWLVFLGHRPMITFEEVHYDEEWKGKKEFKEVLCQNADMYVAGHSHVLEYIKINEPTCSFDQLVSGGGGAKPRRVLKTDVFSLENNGFLILSFLDPTRVVVKFVDINGNVVYEYIKSK